MGKLVAKHAIPLQLGEALLCVEAITAFYPAYVQWKERRCAQAAQDAVQNGF
ncbi:hypothetical protein ACVNS2_07205 [Paenibacillus caseinilyticus]|uniref:Uncharacterized protein n=1 Tax=Paenibacillus mucilaginosus K02 TaxID=997761 RepID=R9UL98_9BACL|nr:hypothetical protein [Paenibacillus mucilaginosus]AGN70596.1 hypothetical protein B2K_38695 [Paenibacillus mucilaginosus K02]